MVVYGKIYFFFFFIYTSFQNVIIIMFILSGYMLLAGRVRKPEEALTIQNILEKHFKRTVNPDALFSEAQVTTQFSKFISTNTV